MNTDRFKTLHTSVHSVVLIIEDNEYDYEIMVRNINKSQVECEIQHCETGEEALDYLYNQGEYEDKEQYRKPALVLLDLNLPGTDGKEVLAEIKSQSELKSIPVVVFSSSNSYKDVQECYQEGVNAYIIKPMNMHSLEEIINTLMLHWLRYNILPLEVIEPKLGAKKL